MLNTSYVRNPVTKAVSVAGYTGKGMTQTAAETVGAGGGNMLQNLVGTVVLAMDMGKIAKLPQSKNPEFNAKLSQFARTAVPIKAADAPN